MWTVPAFRRATLINMFMCFLIANNGLMAFGIYANVYFRKLQDYTGEEIVSPRIATNMFEGMHIIGQILAIFLVKYMGRKTLINMGMIGTSVIAIVASIFFYKAMTLAVMLSIFASIIFFIATTLDTMFIYVTETSQDVVLGFINVSFGAVIMLSTNFTLWLMNTYSYYGFFALNLTSGIICSIFIMLQLKETRGLSDREKKNLYSDTL